MNHSSKNIMQNHTSRRRRTMHSHSYLYSSDCFATPWKWWSAFAHTLSVSYKKKRKKLLGSKRMTSEHSATYCPSCGHQTETSERPESWCVLAVCDWLLPFLSNTNNKSGNGDRERCVRCETALLMAHNHISVKQCVKTALAPSSTAHQAWTSMVEHLHRSFLIHWLQALTGKLTDTWSVAQSEVSKQLYMYGKQTEKSQIKNNIFYKTVTTCC